MTKPLIAAAILSTVISAADYATAEAGQRRYSSSFSLNQLLPIRIVAPSRNTGYSTVPSQSPYYDPSARLRYGFGGYPGNYYRDQNGFFYIRSSSHYWYGIHR